MKGKKLSAQSHNIISTTLGFSPFLPHTYNKAISTLNLISTAVRHISCHRSTLKAGWFDSTDSATALVRPALKNAVYNDIDQYQNLKITLISSILPLKRLKSLSYPTHQIIGAQSILWFQLLTDIQRNPGWHDLFLFVVFH